MHTAPGTAHCDAVRAGPWPSRRDFWRLAPTVLAAHAIVLWAMQILLNAGIAPIPPCPIEVRVQLLSPAHSEDRSTKIMSANQQQSLSKPGATQQKIRRANLTDILPDNSRVPGARASHQRSTHSGAPALQRQELAPLSPAVISPHASSAARRKAAAITPPEAQHAAREALPRANTAPSLATAAQTPETPPSLSASYLHNPKPMYPALARRLGEEGTVMLQVEVSANGKVNDVTIRHTSGFPQLDEAALAAVRQWTFKPAKSAGKPVQGQVLVPIVFSLDTFGD